MEEVSAEVVKTSEMPAGREETTSVVILDKKMGRKLGSGEEQDLEDIASAEGVLELVETPEAVPGGETHIKGPTISGSGLAKAVVRDFGNVCKGGKVFLSDGFYFLYRDAEVKKVLSEDLTDLQMWINTYFDCDDFAQAVAGVMNNLLKGIPFGVLWFKGPNIYHAVNCYYSKEQKKMKVVEPQTNAIYDFPKARWCPMLVLI